MGHGTSSAPTRNCTSCGKPLGRSTVCNSVGAYHPECHPGVVGPYARIAELEAENKTLKMALHALMRRGVPTPEETKIITDGLAAAVSK